MDRIAELVSRHRRAPVRGEKKYPAGTRVWWDDPITNTVRTGTVTRHGRDMQGIYTEVRADDDGSAVELHRSYLGRIEDQ